MSLDIGVAPKKEKRPKKLLEPAPSQENAQDNKLVRALGSVDWHTRESGLLAITALLNQSRDISEDQLMKIWKGIHFAFWHSDKTPVQVCTSAVYSCKIYQTPRRTGDCNWVLVLHFVPYPTSFVSFLRN
jgi:hypothetical protein